MLSAEFTFTFRVLGSLSCSVLSSLSHSECWVHYHAECWVDCHIQSAGFTAMLSAEFTFTFRVLGSLSCSECWVHYHTQSAGFSITLSAGFMITLGAGFMITLSAGFTITLSAGFTITLSAVLTMMLRVLGSLSHSVLGSLSHSEYMPATCSQSCGSLEVNLWVWLSGYVCDMWPRLFRVCWQVAIMIVQICLWHLTQTFQNLLSGDYDCSDMSMTFDPNFSESAKPWLRLFRYVSDMWLRLLRVSWQPVIVSVSICLWHVTQTFQGLLAVTDCDNCC